MSGTVYTAGAKEDADSRRQNFDRVARSYRWLEYLTFGGALDRCRRGHLAHMLCARHALVLGDGDGRFTAALLADNPGVHVLAIDSSRAMLQLLQERVAREGAAARISVLQGDALDVLQRLGDRAPFDLVISHFFLDCLTTAEVRRLIQSVSPKLEADALWIVSEFATPSHWARLVVRSLYRAFRLLTGLRTQHLPAYEQAFAHHGFFLVAEQRRLRGLLRSTIWQKPATAGCQQSRCDFEKADGRVGSNRTDPRVLPST